LTIDNQKTKEGFFMDKRTQMAQLRRALQKFALTLTDESEMMEIAELYPAWAAGKNYAPGDTVKFGENADGETQLYSALQGHASQPGWEPAQVSALWKAVGYTTDGTPIWTQPLGAGDAYQTGDQVSHGGQIWVSTADGNVWEPGVYGWAIYN
jgi:hypothetical protein